VSRQSLESLLQSAGHIVALLRNSQVGAYVYPVVPIEFSNWRSEQRGWRETAVLFDQSHHMAEITVTGPDAVKLLSSLTINGFAGFTPNKAKQMVPCSYDGYVIGDGILFYLDEDELLFVGRTPTVNFGPGDPARSRDSLSVRFRPARQERADLHRRCRRWLRWPHACAGDRVDGSRSRRA